jgi:hypothetical protein
MMVQKKGDKKVIDLPRDPARTVTSAGEKGRSAPVFTMECRDVDVLRRLFKIADDVNKLEFQKLLALPDILHKTSEGDGVLSYSSDPNKKIDLLALSRDKEEFLMGMSKDDLPQYGLAVTRELGSSTSYLTLVDKRQKTIVTSSCGSLHSGYSWQRLLRELKASINEAKRLKKAGKKFEFVYNGNKI